MTKPPARPRRASKRAPAPGSADPVAARGGTGDVLLLVASLALAAALLVVASFSLAWRIKHDTPLMAYIGFLVHGLGAVPYRDFFDMNLPGTHLFFAACDFLVGSSDVGYRAIDVGMLVLLGVVTWSWMRPFGAAP